MAEKSFVAAGNAESVLFLQNLRGITQSIKDSYQLLSVHDYNGCLMRVEKVEGYAPDSTQLKILKAKALAGLHRNWEVVTLTE
jgi:hypothetical protein